MARLSFLTGLSAIVVCTTAGCLGPRVLVVTATSIGMHATPGDGEAQPPQVTLAYKRSETALIPTEAKRAEKGKKDAFSALATLDFMTTWFGSTELTSTIATGLAAQTLAKGSPPGASAPPSEPTPQPE
jgi:hypothetical protein